MNYSSAADIFDKHAQAYQDKYMDVSAYMMALNILLQSLKPKQDKILDLACGPGNLSAYLIQSRPDFTLRACDLAPNMVKLASKNLEGAEVFVMDALELHQLKPRHDVILCGGLLPYYEAPIKEKILLDIFNNLRIKGYLFLSTLITSNQKEDDSKKETTGSPIKLFLNSSLEFFDLIKHCGFHIFYKSIRQINTSQGQQTEMIILAKKEKETKKTS